MRLFFLSTFLLTVFQFAQGQSRYMVQFCEKAESARISASTVALSADAIERRTRQGISLDQTDLPVDRNALASIREIPGVTITGTSRWFNAAFIETTTPESSLAMISALSGICDIEPLRTYRYTVEEMDLPAGNANFRTNDWAPVELTLEELRVLYGFSFNQVQMIKAPFLHQEGFWGRDVRIGVFDSGFRGVDSIEPFRQLWDEGRILDYWNFNEQDDSVFNKGSHGTWVASCMGVLDARTYIGTAPQASYYLYRTEVGEFERVVEEEYWVMAAERADSLGVDVINTSLGYYTFDPEDSLFDHSYEDLDGNTTIISKGAAMAAEKGIMVVVSAGNQGNNEWRFIGAPADAAKALTVGSVDADKKRSSFSSYGPNAAGEIKPEVMAQGSAPYVIATNGQIGQASGTSFSSPIMAGAVACLRQAFPEASVDEMRSAIIRSASHYQNPTDSMGYGIPNFEIAYRLLAGPEDLSSIENLWVSPNPTSGSLTLWLQSGNLQASEGELVLSDVSGRIIKSWTLAFEEELLQMEQFNFSDLAGGTYIFSLLTDTGEEHSFKFVKE